VPRPRTDIRPDSPKVLDKALAALESFGPGSPEWTEAGLRRHLAIPSSTLHRILRGLEAAGYVLRDDAGHYRLGLAAARLGRNASATLDLFAVLEPELRSLGAQTRELVILAVADYRGGVAHYIGIVDSPQRLRVTAEVGATVPLAAGATARALLAFAPPAQVDAVLRRPLHRLAAGTVLDARTIRARLAEMAATGVGVSWEETYDGAWAVAAPVLGEDGRALASIGVAAPVSRHSDELQAGHCAAVAVAAAAATGRLRGATTPAAAERGLAAGERSG
jgi:IclR family acetate operon transcriptional repressor